MNGTLKIFSGSSNEPLVSKICENLGVSNGDIYRHAFPSGERYCQYQENIRGADVYVIQSMNAPVNDYLMELMVMVDAARRASADRITAVIPYMGYLRQDRKVKNRTPISGRMVADMLQMTGICRVIGMDFHCSQAQGFFNIPVDHLTSIPVIADYVGNEIDIVVSPDVGGVKRAHAVAETIESDFAFIAKKRIDDTTVETSEVSGDVKGKRVLIVDDMTESAGTLIAAADACRAAGAAHIRCVVTHGVFTSTARERLSEYNEIDEFIYTDTVQNTMLDDDPIHLADNVMVDKTCLSVAPLFAKAIQRNHTNESISELFKVNGI